MEEDRLFVLKEVKKALALSRAARSRLDDPLARAYNDGYTEAMSYLLDLLVDEWEME